MVNETKSEAEERIKKAEAAILAQKRANPTLERSVDESKGIGFARQKSEEK